MSKERNSGLLAPRPLELYHARTRARGANPLVYWPIRLVVKLGVLAWFRVRRVGFEHVPPGAVILASNHRSFLDPFLIGCLVRRPIYFVAKQELFANPLVGWLLNCLGAFPVRRQSSDEETVETALHLLRLGRPVVIFPEGTRVATGSLGTPKRGVGRLALQSGAPVVPIAVAGTERARDGILIKPVKVHLRCGAPLTFPRVDDPSPFLAGEVTERIWPCVTLQWEWLGGLPPLRTAAVVGAGSTGAALAEVLTRAGLELEDRGDVDLAVLAVPSRELPASMAELGARVSRRSAVLVASRGPGAPFGTTPSAYVSERVAARAVASLSGSIHAREVVIASLDPDLRRQLAQVLEAGGLSVEATGDWLEGLRSASSDAGTRAA